MWSNVVLVVIAFTVLVCIYYFAQPSKSREQFALNVEQDYRESMTKAFNNILGRDPQEYEVQLYRDSMTSPYDTAAIEKKLQSSAEFMGTVNEGKQLYEKQQIDRALTIEHLTQEEKQPVKEEAEKELACTEEFVSLAPAPVPATPDQCPSNGIASLELGLRLDVYRVIVSVYEENLDRLPSMKELNYYTLQLTDAKSGLTKEKMIDIIKTSSEYKTLKENQKATNAIINAKAVGGTGGTGAGAVPDGASLADAKLVIQIEAIYKSMFNTVPNAQLLAFLKIKFVEYKMDEPRFKKMLQLLNKMDTDQWSSVGSCSVVQQETVVMPKPKPMPQPVAACEPKREQAFDQCSAQNSYNKNKFYDGLYTNMKSALPPTCSATVEKNQLANRQKARNASELAYECNRTSTGSSAPYDYDPNVVPQLRNTKFGTFLDDAENTNVGSILPKFVYKEYGHVN